MTGSVPLIGIEEHWTFDRIDNALRAAPAALVDESLVLNEHGDAAARLADIGAAGSSSWMPGASTCRCSPWPRLEPRASPSPMHDH